MLELPLCNEVLELLLIAKHKKQTFYNASNALKISFRESHNFKVFSIRMEVEYGMAHDLTVHTCKTALTLSY